MTLEALAISKATDMAAEAANDYDGYFAESQRDDIRQELITAALVASKRYRSDGNAATPANWQIAAMRNRLRNMIRDDARGQKGFERDLASESGAAMDWGADLSHHTNTRGEAVIAAYMGQTEQYAADTRADEHQSDSRCRLIWPRNDAIRNSPGQWRNIGSIDRGQVPVLRGDRPR